MHVGDAQTGHTGIRADNSHLVIHKIPAFSMVSCLGQQVIHNEGFRWTDQQDGFRAELSQRLGKLTQNVT